MTHLPVVAVLGSTGHLGSFITLALLSPPFRPRFKDLRLLARKSSHRLSAFESQDATIEIYDEDDLCKSFRDVDVLINCIGTSGFAFRDKLLKVLAHSSIKLYFPSEFGVNHYAHDFAQPEWDHKQHHMQLAKTLIPHIRICTVFNALFLEDSIGPWFGFDTENAVYEVAGSRHARISFTALEDVARAVATLAAMPPEDVPAAIQIAGDTVSFEEIAQIMGAAGGGEISVKEIDGKAYREDMLGQETTSPEKHLRFLMGDGAIDYSSSGRGNQDDVVNPEERDWRWKTVTDLARRNEWKTLVLSLSGIVESF